MKYRLLAIDLDDTFVRDDLSLSQANIDAVIKAQELGVKVVIATGRPTSATADIAQAIKLKEFGGYTITYNGGIIRRESDGKLIREMTITRGEVAALKSLADAFHLYIQTYSDSAIITPKDNQYTQIESRITGLPVEDVGTDFMKVIGDEVIKVIILEDPIYLKECSDRIYPIVKNQLSMNFSKPFFLEFMNIHVDKKKSIEYLLEMLNLDHTDLMAIGDSYNDLEMIRFARCGVAMGNANDDIKSVADYVTLDNMHDGVAHAVEKFILQ
ncbi:MAG: Cof-type HAD-IIB family hydrolase [Clostridiales Family XIII bacterium]|jgi:Cof subfamily protein (haloacid dehalogenase superfamily)|nr:Cof-type HAD-IIB family hydrolase [Clostridiales Family XIII bacterium]